VSLPVEPERLRRLFPALDDEDVAAYQAITRRILADPRSGGRVLADVMAQGQRAREKQASSLELASEERLALAYLDALAKMQHPPDRG
jgi:hypothetical protein